ncbi:glycosyltransferase domain-containing protein [Azohydromonas sediminis]|uniref:glycosyltransferase domain-containing protein n=1 Tax=Azohydromonas sediminis TaxID=2259674 RepID=UPI0013C2DBAC|nr:glycosyltransferase domain-containing protein [Azohydromonas sediminis]
MTEPVVYTCVTAGYDKVAPVSAAWQCRFVLFHDGSVEIPAGWEGRRLNVAGLRGASLNRYAKMLPHRLGLQGELSLYVDGNVFFKRDPAERIRSVLAEAKMAAFRHPQRDCAYAELRENLRLGFIGPGQAWRHVRKFRHGKLPRKGGLFEANVLFRRHTDPQVVALDELWWSLWQDGLGRDQPLLSAALWATGMNVSAVGPDVRADASGVLGVRPHAVRRTRLQRLPKRLAAEIALYRWWLPR